MGENGKQEELEKGSIKCEIELLNDGNLSVKCPMIGDTLFMCGLLQMAQAVVFQYKAGQSKIVQPKGNLMDWVRKKRF